MAPYGQAAIQKRLTLQSPLLITTSPFSTRMIAPVGHALRHGASSQWLQSTGMKWRVALGYVPSSTYFTVSRNTPRGTSNSALHATEQAWHPIHVRKSINIPKRAIHSSSAEGSYLSGRLRVSGRAPCPVLASMPWHSLWTRQVYARTHGRGMEDQEQTAEEQSSPNRHPVTHALPFCLKSGWALCAGRPLCRHAVSRLWRRQGDTLKRCGREDKKEKPIRKAATIGCCCRHPF